MRDSSTSSNLQFVLIIDESDLSVDLKSQLFTQSQNNGSNTSWFVFFGCKGRAEDRQKVGKSLTWTIKLVYKDVILLFW